MENIPTRNQNPGDLKDPSTGQIRSFSSPQEGHAALLNDITAKMTGTSTTGISGKSSIAEFAKVYAPPSDNNDSAGYAANLANKLGVAPDTQIGTLTNRIGEFADAISANEGYKGGSSSTDSSISQPKQNGYKSFSESLKDLPQAQQPTVEKGNPVVNGIINAVPGAKDLGEGIGTSLAYFGEKAKGLLGGQDNSKYIPKADIGKTLGGAAKAMGTAAAVGVGGLIGKVASGAGALEAPEIGYNIPMEMTKFLKLGRTEQLNVLGEAMKSAEVGDAEKIAQAIKYLKPKASAIKKIAQGGLSLAKGYLLQKTLGDTVGGLIHRNTGH